MIILERAYDIDIPRSWKSNAAHAKRIVWKKKTRFSWEYIEGIGIRYGYPQGKCLFKAKDGVTSLEELNKVFV